MVKANRQLRRKLPLWGRLHIDRQQPFLCVYRRPDEREDKGTDRLLFGQASYLFASGTPVLQPSLAKLVAGLVEALRQSFDAVIILEVWSVPAKRSKPLEETSPTFRILAPGHHVPEATLKTLERSIYSSGWLHGTPKVSVDYPAHWAPPGLPVLLPHAREHRCVFMGLEVDPIYRDAKTGAILPVILRTMRRHLGMALKRAFFTFSHNQANYRPVHYHELGRTTVSRAVRETDRRLATLGDTFDLLLHITPVNTENAWRQFKASGFRSDPEFHYRPMQVDPATLKYELYRTPLDRIEDPTLHHLFAVKRDEMDREITMLGDRGSPRFRYGSQQVFGVVDETLLTQALDLLTRLPPAPKEKAGSHDLDAEAFARRAGEELDYYRKTCPELEASVHICDDIPGLLVSKGRLLLERTLRVPPDRVEATLQHEVGTHILTFCNGQQQPFRQFHTGMAGYEELQEGIAVLAEYLTGGLDTSRLRLLAGRVVAVHALTGGADFIQTFCKLHHHHGFNAKTAFITAMRVYRGGGFTKDLVYLRGLIKLLEHLRAGNSLEELLLGKITLGFVNLLEELKWRKITKPGLLRPRYLDSPTARTKLARLKNNLSLIDLVDGRVI